jgi:Fe2+ transport system protein FeoA
MTCSNDPVIGRNTLLQNFATPERDSSDAVFTIARPNIDVKELVLQPMLVGDSSTVNASVNLCNVGRVPWIVDSTILRGNTWIGFNDSLRGDTLKPGACFTLRFAALPLDTGLLTDVLDVIACNDTVSLPIQVRVSDRKLPMLADGTDFGNVCVGQFSRRRVQVLRNDDPIPVVINAVFSERGLLSQFRVVNFPANTIVQPGATLEADLEFAPTAIGADTAMIVVRYAGSTTVRKRFSVLGVGKGAVINTSHNALPFVPEIVEREVTLTNASDITVTVVSATLTAGAPFTVLTALPTDIRAGDSIRIGLRYDGGTIPNDAALTFAFDPCAVARTVQLRAYRGQAVVSIPDVSADPRGDASIPINVDVTEPVPYAGIRSLEGAFTVNPRLFLARSVAVEGGEGVVLSQDVVNDRRVVRYRITRRFDKSGTAGVIVGWAGLAEVDSSALTVDTTAPNFGVAVTTTGRNGLLRILNPDPSRRVVDRPLPVVRIAPNPVDDRASVTIIATQSAEAACRIVDAQGRLVRTLPPVSIRTGEQQVDIAVDDLLPGVYTVILTGEFGTTSATMVVL